jgi:DNA-binding transcriptional ArsR family regulator
MREDSVFSALSDPSRRRLLETLAGRESASLTQLAAQLPVTRQAVSKHLTALGQAGLVESSRAGRETRYRLTPQPLDEAVAWMERIGGQWDERLARLREHLGRG